MSIKTPEAIKQIKAGGKLMGKILAAVKTAAVAGRSTLEIDQLAEQKIIKQGGSPIFKGYTTRASDIPFPSSICASVNTELVHAIARPDVILQDGDIFSIDIGMKYPVKNSKFQILNSKFSRGYVTDTAITFAVGKIPEATKKLLAVTKQALEEGIKAAQPGNSVAAIGKAVETYVRSQGAYGIVRDLVGHGVGYALHEEPHIPNYYDPGLEAIILKPGMVIAIEPMISISGEQRVRTKADGWTIEMKDRSICAHFEHTVIITKTGNIVATRRPNEEKEKLW